MDRLNEDWIDSIRLKLQSFTAVELKQELERVLITGVMANNNFNQTATAKALGINRGTLRSKLIKHGLITVIDREGE